VFGEKAAKGGFQTIEVFDRHSMTLDEMAVYPLFTPEFLEWLKKSIPPTQQDRIIYTAHIRGKKGG
jgi:hypothetical protein